MENVSFFTNYAQCIFFSWWSIPAKKKKKLLGGGIIWRIRRQKSLLKRRGEGRWVISDKRRDGHVVSPNHRSAEPRNLMTCHSEPIRSSCHIGSDNRLTSQTYYQIATKQLIKKGKICREASTEESDICISTLLTLQRLFLLSSQAYPYHHILF